jgi:hypothetical protein
VAEWNYAEVATRLEAGALDYRAGDAAAIMALLGFEVAPHARLGFACRPERDGGHWLSMPDFQSADDAELWTRNIGGFWDDLGRERDGTVYAGYSHPDYGNDYGTGKRLGIAMWAALVRLIAKVPAE